MQPVQLKMARAALALSVDDLASLAGLSHVAIGRLESGEDGDEGLAGRLRAVFEERGIEFIDQDTVRARSSPAAGTVPLDDLNSENDE